MREWGQRHKMSELYSNITGRELDRGEAVNDSLLFDLLAGIGATKIANSTIKAIGNGLQRKQRYQKALEIREKSKDWGIPYRSASGDLEKAINVLRQKQRGFVPSAFTKEGIGEVDLPWGIHKKDGRGYGLKHIIERRKDDKIDIDNFFNNMPNFAKNGFLTKDSRFPTRNYIEDDTYKMSIDSFFNGKPRNFIITAFEKYSNKK